MKDMDKTKEELVTGFCDAETHCPAAPGEDRLSTVNVVEP